MDDGRILILSDTHLGRGRLAALSASYEAGATITLSLTEFDPDSGSVRRDVPIAQFRDLWEKRIPCQAAVAEGRIVASVGG